LRLKTVFINAIWHENPIFHQILGVCSALAVTTRVQNAFVMFIAVMISAAGTNALVSLLKKYIPFKIRLIIEMILIATLVILFDLILKAFYYDMSKQLGPYVGLIITNCILLGRAEAFALKNALIPSVVDGIGNGIGYGIILISIAAVREVTGAGTFAGLQILPSGVEPARAMLLAPGAFIIMGVLIWIMRAIQLKSGGSR
jgi:Na+-transporting NADH:ubiquinone oxidoreductase subunit D